MEDQNMETGEYSPVDRYATKLSDAELHQFIANGERAIGIAKQVLLHRALGHTDSENMVEDLVVRELSARLKTFRIKGYPQTFPDQEPDNFDPKKPLAFRNPSAGKVMQFMGECGDGFMGECGDGRKLSFEVVYGDNQSVIETRYADGRRFRTGDDWADIVNIKPEAQPQTGTRHRPKS